MTKVYGLTPQGFVPKQQAEIIAEITDDLRAQFGNNINLGAESIWAQIIGAFSEREATLHQLAEAVYNAQFPAGAEGLAVDNLLALNNLQRLPARPSVTDPTPAVYADGTTLYGLVLFGTPGATIPGGTLLRSSPAPQHDFSLDASVTIQAAVNGQQTLTLSSVPTQGTFALTLISGGNTLVTRAMPFNTLPNLTQLSFASAPSSGTYQLMMGGNLTAPLAFNAQAADVQAALRAIGDPYRQASVTSTGSGFSIGWGTGNYCPTVQPAAASLAFAAQPGTGAFALTVGTATTASIPAPFAAIDIQNALVAIGYPRARVATNGTATYAINLQVPVMPALSVAANTTGQAATLGTLNKTGAALGCIDSLQGVLNNLADAVRNVRPFSDALVVAASNGFAITFGAGSVRPGEPPSAAMAIPVIVVSQSSLQNGSTLVNLSVTLVASGAPAEAVGTATCTEVGPLSVPAGTLTTIATPVAGLTGVTNQLDVLPGADIERDEDALIRRSGQLSSKANGPLPSIIDKVSLLPGVTNVVGFVNQTNAALQVITFAQVPTSGSFALILGNGQTASIPFNATSGAVQSAIAAVPGYSSVQVTGTVAFGMSIDFQGAFGGQGQPLVQIANNTTGVSIATAFGRPPRAIELVVEGGASAQIAQTIFASAAAGSATYGTPAATVNGNVAQDSAIVTVASAQGIVPGLAVAGTGIQPGTQVVSVSGPQVTLSRNAIATYSGVTLTFTNAVQVADRYGNVSLISFSRPTPLLFYVTIALVTDQYRTPGLPGSGANGASQFKPTSMAQIQRDVVSIGNMTPIGGTVIGFGYQGLIGAFNEVPGVVGYTLNFGTTPNPTGNANVQMLPTQVATFQNNLVSVSYT